MNSRLQAHLSASPRQAEQLQRLQEEFAQACNAIAPLAQRTHCWNRVALHHMVYRQMRERFPNLGSQMVCNAIYAVSRTCRIVYQSPESPFNVGRVGLEALPVIQFAPGAPVYFDRHTLSLKDGQASLFTLDGRMHFDIRLADRDLERLANERLREIVLTGRGAHFVLTFVLDTDGKEDAPPPHSPAAKKRGAAVPGDEAAAQLRLPGYVHIVPRAEAPASAGPSLAAARSEQSQEHP